MPPRIKYCVPGIAVSPELLEAIEVSPLPLVVPR